MAEQPPPADAADGAPLPSAASSEYSSDSDDETWEERAPWILIYGVLALCCVIAEAAMVRRAIVSTARDST